MQDAQSDIKRLQKQYKDNKEELNKAMAAMYKEKGINPLGCILPLLVQMPIWFALFRVLREPLAFIPSSSNLSNSLAVSTGLKFFNMDLQIPPSEVAEWIERVPYLVLILLVILTALYQQNQITKKTGKSDNPQAQQMQMVGKVMPAVVLFYVSIFTNSKLLQHANVDTFIVFRSCCPLLVLPLEYLFLVKGGGSNRKDGIIFTLCPRKEAKLLKIRDNKPGLGGKLKPVLLLPPSGKNSIELPLIINDLIYSKKTVL